MTYTAHTVHHSAFYDAISRHLAESARTGRAVTNEELAARAGCSVSTAAAIARFLRTPNPATSGRTPVSMAAAVSLPADPVRFTDLAPDAQDRAVAQVREDYDEHGDWDRDEATTRLMLEELNARGLGNLWSSDWYYLPDHNASGVQLGGRVPAAHLRRAAVDPDYPTPPALPPGDTADLSPTIVCQPSYTDPAEPFTTGVVWVEDLDSDQVWAPGTHRWRDRTAAETAALPARAAARARYETDVDTYLRAVSAVMGARLRAEHERCSTVEHLRARLESDDRVLFDTDGNQLRG